MKLLEFECERCGATLKVRPMLAGRSVQCPKCRKKTAVPDPNAAPAPEQPAAADTANIPPPTAPAVSTAPPPAAPAVPTAPPPAPAAAPPKPPPEPAPPPPVRKPQPPAAEPAPPPAVHSHPTPAPAPVRAPAEPDNAETIKEFKSLQAEVMLLKRCLSEAEAAAETARGETDALRRKAEQPAVSPADGRLQAELEAARNRIRELDGRLETTREQLKLAREAIAAGHALPSEAVDFGADEEADAMLGDLRTVKFGKIVRTAVIAHVIVILATSLGYIYGRIQARQPARPDPAADPMAVAPQAATAAPDQDVSPFDDEPDAPKPAPAPAPAPRDTRPADRPLSDIERRIQELPAPDERPESDVRLDF